MSKCKVCRKQLLTKQSNTKGLWVHLTSLHPVDHSELNKLVQEDSLPLPGKLARKYLAIPASSTKSERVFSEGGNVVTQNRTGLEPGKVESIVVINRNKSILNAYKFEICEIILFIYKILNLQSSTA